MATEQFKLEPHFPDPGPIPEEMETSTELMPRQEVSLSEEALLLAGHLGRITAKLEAELMRLEELGNGTAQMINAVIPTDQASYDEMFAKRQDGVKFLETAEIFIDPWKQIFYRPYQGVLGSEKRITGATKLAVAGADQRRIAFERECKAAEARETLRQQAAARKREEDQRLATAVQAEEIGMSPAAVESILTQPSIAPRPVAAPMVTRPQGMRKLPELWVAELEDKDAFWKWARQQKEMPACFVESLSGPVQVVMNRESKTCRATLGQKYPGWRGVDKNH